MIELILAFATNLKEVAIIVAIATGVVYAAGTVFFTLLGEDIPEGEVKAIKPRLRFARNVCAACAIIACIPSVNDLWKVRIGLIKYHLASPDNVQKASEKILEIGHKLECKYIGCDEEKMK